MFRRREQGSAAPPTWFSYDSWSSLSCKLFFCSQQHSKDRQNRNCKLYQIHNRNVVHCHTHGLFNWSAGSGSYSSAQHLECRDRLTERGTKKVQIACEQSMNQFFYWEPPSLSLSSVGIYDIGDVFYFQWRFDCFIWVTVPALCVCRGEWEVLSHCEYSTAVISMLWTCNRKSLNHWENSLT